VLVEYLARIESKEDGKSLLVFDEIEGQHVLRAIYVAGQEGYQLPAAGKQHIPTEGQVMAGRPDETRAAQPPRAAIDRRRIEPRDCLLERS
jgi:hypothetical protein